MVATDILDTFKRLGITAYVNGDKLIVEPGSKVPPELALRFESTRRRSWHYCRRRVGSAAASRRCRQRILKARLASIAVLPAGVPPAAAVGGVRLKRIGRITWSLNTDGGSGRSNLELD
jgi:hypothetical protein